jgi:hypothetical protein
MSLVRVSGPGGIVNVPVSTSVIRADVSQTIVRVDGEVARQVVKVLGIRRVVTTSVVRQVVTVQLGGRVVSVGIPGPAGPPGDPESTWQHYAMNVRYTGVTYTIPSGSVLVALYGVDTIYRFIDDSTDIYGYPIEDSFYSSFSDPDLSDLIITRG